MSDSLEMDKCDFCQEIKQVERTYLHPSKYVKEKGAFINKTLYNEGDYFIIVKTCIDCGTPTSSQTEIMYSEKEVKSAFKKGFYRWNEPIEISDEEIENVAWEKYTGDSARLAWVEAIKWYKEQLKSRQ